ncbi:MAG TPA: NAD-dependent epimerase/dehydratase family protein [Legionellaceae bacterium]|nr:NAD-dependent epimerase/dehydratase family protein [Legionellaceae bacterium]
MKILMTGCAGFIGSRLLTKLCKQFGAHNIIAFSSKENQFCQTIVYKDVKAFDLNQDDYKWLNTIEIIIHAGAYIPKSTFEPNQIERCTENILFTQALFQLPLPKLKKIIFLSTVDVYENTDLITEATSASPLSLYGMSKLYCEKIVAALDKNIMKQILRIGHVYGPGEEMFKKFLPLAIQNIIRNEPVELWGDGSDRRSFIYLDDVVNAICNAIALEEEIGPINIVGGVGYTLRELLAQLESICGKTLDIKTQARLSPKRNYVFDNTKLKSYLLQEETPLREGLEKEYHYFEALCSI